MNIPAISSHSADAKEITPPPGGWLTAQELAKWSVVREKLGVDLRKYENLKDEKVVQKIREHIHPKVWRYWPKAYPLNGKSDIQTQQTTKAAIHSYDVPH